MGDVFERLYLSPEKKEGGGGIMVYRPCRTHIKLKNIDRTFLLFFSLLGHTLAVPCRSLSPLQQPSDRRQRI